MLLDHIHHHFHPHMSLPQSNGATSDIEPPPKPRLFKRHTLPSKVHAHNPLNKAIDRIHTTFHKIKSGSTSSRQSGSSTDSHHNINNFNPTLPGFVLRKGCQCSVSRPCTRKTLEEEAKTQRAEDALFDRIRSSYEHEHPNRWYNHQRKIQGACNYYMGHSDWKSIAVFDDEDEIDETCSVQSVKPFWAYDRARPRSDGAIGHKDSEMAQMSFDMAKMTVKEAKEG